jgi:hydroxyacylglutathione hydrolase
MSRLQVELIPILDDNYVFLLTQPGATGVAVVDPGDGKPVLDHLERNQMRLELILITHHHGDHIDGVKALKERFPEAKICAPLKNQMQIPFAAHWVQDQDVIPWGSLLLKVIELPGHTLGHVAYFESESSSLFSGDVLFGLSCGRLFEGTPEMAFASLQKIKALPLQTKIYCTHEYTWPNVKFVDQMWAENKMPRQFDTDLFRTYKPWAKEHRPTVPLVLAEQLRMNPFLLSENVEQFAKLREARNHFRSKPD